TELMMGYDTSSAYSRKRDAVAAVVSAYYIGKSYVQAMDNHGGMLPAEMILNLAAANDSSTLQAIKKCKTDQKLLINTYNINDLLTNHDHELSDSAEPIAQIGMR